MIQVYTGKGKGKTTAALGLAIRAAGAGLKVYICQFLKGGKCSELASLKKFKHIKIERFGNDCFVRRPAQEKDIREASRGLKSAARAIFKKYYDVVILDEICVAIKLKLLKPQDVIGIIKKSPSKTELILTGRGASKEIIKAADLVSDIKEKKHYYRKGVKARRGIEY
ncbi:MAG: cob(I)yrinic acid a,c-diamide adenosyltransferase [Candidatus Omnitrophica bacterium]|nr:cob(I)yrinic acid a,c-diamide adenosyltransferase [Candidatus Omnitrophota bacterium]